MSDEPVWRFLPRSCCRQAVMTRLCHMRPLTNFSMLLRSRWAAPSGFIEPCLPSSAERPPSGPGWIHEIKHDGYGLMARRDPIGIRLLTWNGHDWALRYPLIVGAVDRLKVRSCLIDGEPTSRLVAAGHGIVSADRRNMQACPARGPFDVRGVGRSDSRCLCANHRRCRSAPDCVRTGDTARRCCLCRPTAYGRGDREGSA